MLTGIKYYTFAGPASGYGRSAQSYICGLIDQGLELTWHPLKWDQSISYFRHFTKAEVTDWINNTDEHQGWEPKLVERFHRSINYSHLVMQVVPEYWPSLIEQDKVNIGYTTWEADKLPRHWPELLNQVDQLLVPSEFNHKVFSQELPNLPTSIIPHIIDKPQSASSDAINAFREKYGVSETSTVFYSINTWSVRKDLEALIRAYIATFSQTEDVTLIIKTSEMGPRYPNSIQRESVQTIYNDLISSFDPHPKIIFIAQDDMPATELDAIHQIGDCYISLTRGEGWGMGAAEAASRKNPVLITGWSGVLDFLGDDYQGLIDYALLPAIDLMGRPSFDPSQKWALANPNDASSKMRHVYENLAKWKAMATEYSETLIRFNSENVSRLFLEVIND